MSDIYLWYDVIHSICHSQSEHPNKALLPQGFLGSGVTKLYFTKSLSGTGTIPDLESHPFSFSLACAFPLGPCIAAVLPQFPFPSHPLLFQSPMQPFTFLPSYPSASFPSPSILMHLFCVPFLRHFFLSVLYPVSGEIYKGAK